jgi:hypothetical protein
MSRVQLKEENRNVNTAVDLLVVNAIAEIYDVMYIM